MPGAPRQNAKAIKIAYTILKTPKELRQGKPVKPSAKTIQGWSKDSAS